MQINKIQNVQYGSYPKAVSQKTAKTVDSNFECKDVVKPDVASIRANFAPNINFTGNAPKIKNAYIITGEEKDVPLLITKKNDSYVVDFDSQTEIIYGEDAINYLKSKEDFEYDTQVIFPKKSDGTLLVKEKEVPLPENSAVMINSGTKAKIKINNGYPMVLVTKKDYDWYERYGKEAQDGNIKNKFLELIYYNSHLYNGEFIPNIMLDESLRDEKFLSSIGIKKYESKNNLVYDLYDKRELLPEDKRKEVEKIKTLLDKMYATDVIEGKGDGYIRFKNLRKPEAHKKILEEKGFSQEEIDLITPIYSQTRQTRLDTKTAFKNKTSFYSPEMIQKLKATGFLFDAKVDDGHVYWKEGFGNENILRRKLYEAGFSKDEEDKVVESWKQANMTGFDLSGLKFINEDLAVYNLNDKLNNWTHEKTNWATNSTALSSTEENTPFVGVSMVQYDDEDVVKMSKIRSEEILHAHPNFDERRQTEIYVVSSGAAALNIVKDGKSDVQILKEGDLAVVGPGVMHCVNSILGEYEHIVAQVPSAFQYGFGFKSIVEPPEDYDKEALEDKARQELLEYKNNI